MADPWVLWVERFLRWVKVEVCQNARRAICRLVACATPHIPTAQIFDFPLASLEVLFQAFVPVLEPRQAVSNQDT